MRKEGTEEALEKMNTILYELTETIRHITLLLQPFMPDSSSNILNQLAVSEDNRTFEAMNTPLAYGTPIDKPEGVFPRFQVDLDDEKAS